VWGLWVAGGRTFPGSCEPQRTTTQTYGTWAWLRDPPTVDGIDSHPTAKLEGGDITLLEWLCTRGPCAAWWSKCSG